MILQSKIKRLNESEGEIQEIYITLFSSSL